MSSAPASPMERASLASAEQTHAASAPRHDPASRGAGRGNHGGPHCGPSGQRRHPGGAARPGRRPGQGPGGIAEAALQSLSRAKPAAFYDPASIRLIQPGTFDHDLARLSKCDWVIEAVTENLAIKQELLAKITPFLKPGVILTTNTSGLPGSQHRRGTAA